MTTPARTAAEIAALLLARDPLPPLVPAQVYDPSLTGEIGALSCPASVKAGLHLLNDDLAHSHTLAQSGQGDPLSDYWHAVIHRREGDWDNARYWFHRVGSPPILVQIYGPDPHAPHAFVERCRTVGRGSNADLERFQQKEMAQLLAYALIQAS